MIISNFKCPACGKRAKIEEVYKNALVATPLNTIDTESEDAEFGDNELVDGTVAYYQCMACGSVLKDHNGNDIDSMYSLCEYLKDPPRARPAITDPDQVFDSLEEMIDELRQHRDCQEIIKEPEDETEPYVYNDYDVAIDALGVIHNQYTMEFKHRVEDLEKQLLEPDLEEAVRQGILESIVRINPHTDREWRQA